MTQLTIASVYVHGHRKAYGADWVARLHHAAERNAGGMILRHVCLTDSPAQVKAACRHLQNDMEAIDIGKWWQKLGGDTGAMRGWWAKVQLFNQHNFFDGERILAIDIDNLIVGDLRGFVEAHAKLPAVMAPHTAPNFNPEGTINHFSSTVMLWDHCALSDLFIGWDPAHTKILRGDQDYFGLMMPGLPTFAHGYMIRMPRGDEKRPPDGCVFVAGGKVKPNEAAITRDWVRKAWRLP